ncbi:uncharacterized protein LOC131880725 isoform X2 [Tigriopus californicus]|uniref:uncharacterized protein LOC131880725 isoform X2 n=1 Tax=Tigriopus californicus TaxID=6832 RepID=UPI0027DA088D|nr:uncharacterized protein LOC131880725 isoform X2 [Tigriopus californicus]
MSLQLNKAMSMMIGFEAPPAPRIIMDVMAIMAMIVCGETLYNWLNYLYPPKGQPPPKEGSADKKRITKLRKRRKSPRDPAQRQSYWWLESAMGPASFGVLVLYAYQFHCYTPFIGATVLNFCRYRNWMISAQDKEEFFSNISYPTGEVLALGYWNGYLKAFCHKTPIYLNNEHMEFDVDVIIVIPNCCTFAEASLLEHGFEEVGSHQTCVPGRGFNQRSEITKKVYKYKTDMGESKFVIVDFPSNLRSGMNGNPIPEIIAQIQQLSVLRSLAASSSDTDQL